MKEIKIYDDKLGRTIFSIVLGWVIGTILISNFIDLNVVIKLKSTGLDVFILFVWFVISGFITEILYNVSKILHYHSKLLESKYRR